MERATLPNNTPDSKWYEVLVPASTLRRIGLSLALTGCASTSTLTLTPETGNPSVSLDRTRWSAAASRQQKYISAAASRQQRNISASNQLASPLALREPAVDYDVNQSLPPSSALPSVPAAPQTKPVVHAEASSLSASSNTSVKNNFTLSPPQDESSLGDGRTEDGDGGNLHIGRLLKATSIKEHQLIFLAGMRKKLGVVATCMEKVDKRRKSGNQFEPNEVTCFMDYKEACVIAAETPEGESACVGEYNSNVQYMTDMAERALNQASKK